ncbi:MAG: serine hydrolase [Alphaproteobacteria bacterium]|nr:serine hydrolase [Alphaproteobacteria bacterium]
MDIMLQSRIEKAHQAGELDGLHGVMIVHKGETLAEQYFSGADERWGQSLGVRKLTPTSLHDLRSVTKSIVSLLYGIALAEGQVPGLDDSLVSQFPELGDLAADPQRRKMTVRHALSMKMGTEWNEDLPYTDPRNSEIAMEMAEDRYRFILDRPMAHEPGAQWVYSGGATALIGHFIAKGTGKSLDAYATEKLFKPLGIEEFDWIRGADGVPSSASGLRLNIHDLAKIGRLILQDGVWKGRQVVPKDWLMQALTPHAKPEEGIRYGLFWWLGPEGEPPYWVAGIGNGGQRLTVSKGSELIVVVFAGNYNKLDAWKLPVKVITDFALPAIQNR